MTELNLDAIDLTSFQDEEETTAEQLVNESISQRANANMPVAMTEDPDQHARNLQLSRDSGVPVQAVRDDPQSVETDLRLRQIDFDSMSRSNPQTARFVTDYDNAVLTQDDLDSLTQIEGELGKWGNRAAGVGERGTSLGGSAAQFFGKIFGGLEVRMMDFFNQEDTFTYQMEQFLNSLGMNSKITVATPEELRENGYTVLMEFGDQAVGSIVNAPAQNKLFGENLAEVGQQVTETDLGYVPRETFDAFMDDPSISGFTGMLLEEGPKSAVDMAGMAFMPALYFGGRTEELTQERAENDGRDPNQATLTDYAIGGITQTVVQAIDRFSLSKILGRTATPVVNRTVGQVVANTGRATLTEGATEAVQGGLEYLGTNVGTEAGFEWTELGRSMLAEGLIGGPIGGVVAGTSNTIDYVSQRSANRDAEQVTEQGFIDNIDKMATESKLHERDPERFRQFIEQVDGDNNTQIFIDGVQLRMYLAQPEVEAAIAGDPALQLLAERADEAAQLGTDVGVPIGDFAAQIAGTEHFSNLREFMTAAEDSVAPFRQEQAREETQRYMEALVNEAQQNVSEYVEAQNIFDQVRQQLIDTGVYSPQNADTLARIVPAWATVYARDNGISVAEAYQRSGLIIEGPQSEASRSLRQEVEPPVIDPEQVQKRFEGREVQADPDFRTERRRDDERRTRISQMSPEEQYRAIYTHELTGLNNRRAFEEDLPNAPVVVSIDADNLKTVNDNLGPDAGDTLLKIIGKALHDASGGQAYHISGDEFYLLGDDQAALEAALEAAQAEVVSASVSSDRGELRGLQFTYGIADSKEAADALMKQEKVAREERGERAARGALPSNLTLKGKPAQDIDNEILKQRSGDALFSTSTDVDAFVAGIQAAKAASANGASVFEYSPEEYAGMELFMSEDGMAGFAIKDGDELVSVFKHPDSQMKGALDNIVPLAISVGATKLDAFDGFLTEAYSRHGFEEVSRVPFDEEFAPADWNYEQAGRPDVVFMELNDEIAKQAREERFRVGAGVSGETSVLAQQDEQTTRQVEVAREANGNLNGLPQVPGFEGMGHSKAIADVAQKYAEEAGLEYNPPNAYAPVDEARARRIAEEFDRMEHAPGDPEVMAAYEAMIEETVAQYQAALDAGLRVEFINFAEQGDPYESNPRLAIQDIVENNHMWVFSTRDGFGSDADFDPADNPLLRETPFLISGQPALVNDLFRVVHDYFGHAKEGVGFRAGGEENAWRAHSAMYSPLARKAMTTETRGQNSWVNFGPHGDANRTASAAETHYADQKIGLLPDWVVNEGAADPEPVAEEVVADETFQQRIQMISAVETAVRDMKLPQWKKEDGTARGEDVWQKLQSTGGVKKEELFWIGVEEYLTTEPDRKFTRDEVMNFVVENGVVVEEIQATTDGDGGTTSDQMDWSGRVMDEPDYWEHRVEDHMYMYRNTDSLGEAQQDLYFLDNSEFGEFVSDHAKEVIAELDGALAGSRNELRELVARLKSAEESLAKLEAGQKSLLDELSEQELRINILKLRSYIDAEVMHDSEVEEWVEEKARKAAHEEYMDDPVYRYYSSAVDDIFIEGNDDTGYMVYGPGGEYITDAGIYSVEEAQIRAYDWAVDQGIIESTDSSQAKWGDYVTDGDHQNYREFKLTLPNVPGEFVEDVHFDDPNIVAWMRTTDRELNGEGTFFIDEMQSDWHQTGRQTGYATGADVNELGARRDQIRKRLVDEYQLSAERINMIGFLNKNKGVAGSYEPVMITDATKELAKDEDVAAAVEEYLALGHQIFAEKSGAPDAPFKGEAWLQLALKRAIQVAVEEGHKQLAWPNAQVLMDRWSSRYEQLYRNQYDTKMVSAVKKLTKQKPVLMDLETEEPMAGTEDRLDDVKNAIESEGSYRLLDGRVLRVDDYGLALYARSGGFITAFESVEQAFSVTERDQGYWVIPITDELRERVLNNGFTLFQDQGNNVQQSRGYYQPSNSMIRLTEAANLSTFLHEFAHFAYEMELKSANQEKVQGLHNWFKRNAEEIATEASGYANAGEPDFTKPPVVVTKEDVVKYVNLGGTGDAAKDAAVREATHEWVARGFEAYLMEGKAPSVELRNIFSRFARWLAQVYNNLKGQLRVNLDDEARRVFDRMLATDEQIRNADARMENAPLFTDAAMAGMTEAEFALYQEQQKKVKDVATETLREKLMRQLRREAKAWWKREKADVVDEEIERLKNEPVYRAASTLRGETLKLDHATVKELMGEEVTDKRGRKSFRIPPKLRGMTATGGTGVHPDEAAAFFGFPSGDEMMKTIIATPSINEAADTRAEQIMKDRHGDILNDGTIEQQADEAMQNEERGKLLLQELKNLSRRHNVPTLDRQTIKAMAQENIAKLAYRQIHPGKYRKAEIRAAQEAAVALEQGNTEAAMRAKSRQVMNFYLGQAATEARNETLKIVDRMGRYNKKSVKEQIMKAGEDYWHQLNKILRRFEFRKAATLRSVDEANQDINSWMRDKIDQEGDGLVLSPAVLNEGYVTHWKNVPFGELQGIRDSVTNIEHVARYANKITRMEEEMQFNELVNRWVTKMNEQESVYKSQRTDTVEGRRWGQWAMAQMTKIPFLASWLDGGERVGLSHQILVQPFTDAYDEELKLWKEVGNVVMQAIADRDSATVRRHNRKVFIPEIKDANNDGNLYGHQIIAVALNVGNASNLRKLLLGEGWANPDDDSTISLDNPKLQAVLKHMTRSDWELVQLIWDQMDSLYPQLADVHRRTTGLTPPKIEATPVQTAFGEFRGGYYPMKYDSNRSHQAELNEDRLNAQTDSMFNTIGSIQASVNASATSERTKYYAPVRLNLNVVSEHFQEVIHYITHHDAVREVNRLIRNKEVANTIKEKLGPEEYAQLKPWLNDIAKDGRNAPTKNFFEAILQRLRFGVTIGVMGFKASTGLMQLSGLSNTVAEVGSAATLQSMRAILGSPAKMKSAWEFASANSRVLNHRVQTNDREIKNAMKRLENKTGPLAAAQEASMKHIALIQTYMVDLPTWYAAYIKAMDEHGDETKAYQYADWTVENVQGSGVTKDMAQIMRNQSESSRMFTMFMTFFSSLWNMERDLARGAKSGRYSPTTVAAKAMFLFAIPVAFDMVLRGDFGGDDDDESDLQKYLTNAAMYPMQGVPFARDIANATLGEYGYNMSPIAAVIEQGTQSIPAVVRAMVTDDELTRGQAKGAVKFVGAAVGVPGTSQAWATGEHLYQVLEEGEDLTVREVLFGPDRE